MAGCLAPGQETLRIAFLVSDDSLMGAQAPMRLASAIENATGRPTRIYLVPEASLLLEAVAAGQADAAYVSAASAWYAWTWLDMDVPVITLTVDGRTASMASAWVRQDSPYQSMEDLRGARSCHAGSATLEGALLPMGWLIERGLVAPRSAADDDQRLPALFEAYFSGGVRMPTDRTDPYGEPRGALRCLSEGAGDVAFARDTTPAVHCAPAGVRPPTWCLSGYREIQVFGHIPGRMFVVSDGISTGKREDLVRGFIAVNATEEGRQLLALALQSPGVVPVDSAAVPLGDLAARLSLVPGLDCQPCAMALVANEVDEGEEGRPHDEWREYAPDG